MNKFLKGLVIAALGALIVSVGALAAPKEAHVARAIELISHFESRGDYGCAHNDTNGLPSIGFIQWNGNECMELLNLVIDEDEDAARSILGDTFYAKVRGKTTWSGKMSSSQLTASSKLLKTDAGVRVQNALAKKYVANYMQKGMDLGITDANALVYYADMRHQVGSGAIKKYQEYAAKKAGSYGAITLKHLYDAAMNYATTTKSRRQKAYDMLRENPVTGTADPAPAPDGSVAPTGVRLDPAGPVTLMMNKTLTLTPVVKPEGALATFSWRSLNPRIATVQDGVVTPIKPGTATVQVRLPGGLGAKIKVRVKPVLAESVTLSGDSTMKKGETQSLTWTFSPSDTTKQTLRFKSGNKKVIRVSKKGVVKAVGAGTATVYCQARDGSKRVGRFKITVTP